MFGWGTVWIYLFLLLTLPLSFPLLPVFIAGWGGLLVGQSDVAVAVLAMFPAVANVVAVEWICRPRSPAHAGS